MDRDSACYDPDRPGRRRGVTVTQAEGPGAADSHGSAESAIDAVDAIHVDPSDIDQTYATEESPGIRDVSNTDETPGQPGPPEKEPIPGSARAPGPGGASHAGDASRGSVMPDAGETLNAGEDEEPEATGHADATEGSRSGGRSRAARPVGAGDPEPGEDRVANGLAESGRRSGDFASTAWAAADDAALSDPARLRAVVEAIVLVVDTPTSSTALAQGLGLSVADVESALRALRAEYDADRRGLDLREVAGGWRLYTREELSPYVERFVLEGQQAKLTQAALETLAVVAYRQPVTRSRVSAIRGVNVDGVMRTLLSRGLIEECGADPETGGGLYRTTSFFLEKMGLMSLTELPSLAPLLPDTYQLDDIGLST